MSAPNSFAFRFGDEPQYLHHANKDDEGMYHISWDNQFVELHGVDWYECSWLEVEHFIAEKDGWVICEESE